MCVCVYFLVSNAMYTCLSMLFLFYGVQPPSQKSLDPPLKLKTKQRLSRLFILYKIADHSGTFEEL